MWYSVRPVKCKDCRYIRKLRWWNKKHTVRHQGTWSDCAHKISSTPEGIVTFEHGHRATLNSDYHCPFYEPK